jgi:hypothetical protein
MAKLYGASLLISERTLHRLNERNCYAVRLIDRVKAKGKAEAVTIYEVFDGDAEELFRKKAAIKNDLENAVKLCQVQQFQEARSRFEKCLLDYPEDLASNSTSPAVTRLCKLAGMQPGTGCCNWKASKN